MDIGDLQTSYLNGVSLLEMVNSLFDRIEAYDQIDPAVWIRRESRHAVLEQARHLLERYPARESRPPLFGVPFTVKDSIDVQGIETTTACPPLAFVATRSAVCYQKVVAQGALYLGKVNLDQLATGLSGCRSPYGVTHSVFSAQHISGGSSSGSSVSVGAGLVGAIFDLCDSFSVADLVGGP